MSRAWEAMDANEFLSTAIRLYGILTPEAMDRFIAERARNAGIATYKQCADRAGRAFFLAFDKGSIWRELLQALFQFLTAAKAIAEQTMNFNSPHFRPLPKAALYIHILLDGIAATGALLLSFVLIPGMGTWSMFLDFVHSHIEKVIRRVSVGDITSDDSPGSKDAFFKKTLEMFGQVATDFLEDDLFKRAKDLHSPSTSSEVHRLIAMLVCLGLVHIFTVLALGVSAHDFQAVLTSPVASLGQGGRTSTNSLMAMACKAVLVLAVYVSALWNWKLFQTAVAFTLNIHASPMVCAMMFLALFFLLFWSGLAAAAGLEAAGQRGADVTGDISGYQLAQWPYPQCACSDSRKKQRRSRTEGTGVSAPGHLMTEQLLATSYGACAPQP